MPPVATVTPYDDDEVFEHEHQPNAMEFAGAVEVLLQIAEMIQRTVMVLRGYH